MKPFTSEGIKEVADKLNGTCQSVDDVVCEVFGYDSGMITIEQVPLNLLQELDAMVEMCEECNWWVEPHQLDENGICEDCHRDDEE